MFLLVTLRAASWSVAVVAVVAELVAAVPVVVAWLVLYGADPTNLL